jgi:hypothetical protein
LLLPTHHTRFPSSTVYPKQFLLKPCEVPSQIAF